MKLLIDNLDGNGAIDYSDQVAPEGALQIHRSLNEPSQLGCELLMLGESGPARLGRVVVSRDDGLVLFTGYLSRTAEQIYAGESSAGTVYRSRLRAVSDEWLLDKQGLSEGGESYSLSGSDLLTSLTERTDPARFTTASTDGVLVLGSFFTDGGKTWSSNAGAIAAASCASYRAVAGVIDIRSFGAATYEFATADDTLHLNGLAFSLSRDLVNDVTVTGAMEAGTYVSQVFLGDGSTSLFALASTPFRSFLHKAGELLSDTFQGSTLNVRMWKVSDPGSHLNVGSAGLILTGGGGLDGQTTLASIDTLELGGGLIFEASAVALEQGSDGVLLGIYSGVTSRATCVAGFDVRQSNGSTMVGPLINGAPAGTRAVLQNGHLYLLRLRVHCAEVQRVRQTYNVLVDGAHQSFGGTSVDAPLSLVFELRDLGASTNTAVSVLYDGALPSSPASVQFVPVNSIQLQGSIGSLRLSQTGTAWIRSTTSSGVTATRLIGGAGEGVDCSVSTEGAISFFAGRVPTTGERVIVSYRAAERAGARLQNQASLASEAQRGLPGVAAWQGSVLEPLTRSSEDCANAAAAILATSSDPSGAIEGTYVAEDLPDIWPGDILNFSGSPLGGAVLARSVTVAEVSGAPEVLRTRVTFSNSWASSPSMKLSPQLASDIALPVAVLPGAAAVTPDLPTLTVVDVSQTAITLDAGTTPPAGGGFEVRRRDGGFGPGIDEDLVLRSPVRSFSIPRVAQIESYYMRMYDGSTPPVYSWRSAAVLVNVPVG